MSEQVLNEILEGIRALNNRMDAIERILFDIKIPKVDPTPEEIEIIKEYEIDKKNNNLNIKKLFWVIILDVFITKKANKLLDVLPKSVKDFIIADLKELQLNGFNARLDIIKLKSLDNHYRIRTGEYRIRFELTKSNDAIIYWIGKRSKAYKD